mmetsp:Transcript_41888/g.127019  ORF Transcript_41888/g.127019 Transcript_41888/m.127019 type:complete len:124 (-) Transcript_41888:1175-1546(-)
MFFEIRRVSPKSKARHRRLPHPNEQRAKSRSQQNEKLRFDSGSGQYSGPLLSTPPTPARTAHNPTNAVYFQLQRQRQRQTEATDVVVIILAKGQMQSNHVGSWDIWSLLLHCYCWQPPLTSRL